MGPPAERIVVGIALGNELAQLWHQDGKTEEAEKLLSSVYSLFTEGFETADLMIARALIDNFRNSLSRDRGPLRRTRRLPQ